MNGSIYPEKYVITCRIIGEICLHVKLSYMIMIYHKSPEMTSWYNKEPKILTETNQKLIETGWTHYATHKVQVEVGPYQVIEGPYHQS